MNLLLDTHTLLWATQKPERLSLAARRAVTDSANTIFVSAASAWEMSTKVRLGKLPEAETLEREFLEITQRTGFQLLSIEPETALRAGRLVGTHGDPFDRMIAAQALQLDIPVVSADPKLDSFGIRRIW